MKYQIELTLTIETDAEGTGMPAVEVSNPRLIFVDPAYIDGPSEFAVVGNVDLLGKVPDKPKGRNPLDKSLTDLIDFFSNHESRRSKYVPTWPKDKKLLRPYLEAKGEERVREMLESFVLRRRWGWDPAEDFNAKRVLGAPLTIQAFVGIADCLDVLLQWDSQEVPYSG